jgi:hypothetical protein
MVSQATTQGKAFQHTAETIEFIQPGFKLIKHSLM